MRTFAQNSGFKLLSEFAIFLVVIKNIVSFTMGLSQIPISYHF